MLNHADNELLTRVGRGTPMGDLLRQYWMPAALSAELPEPDGAPLRVRLLGENLIAFRASSGQLGLVAEACPHRGASLFFGRNEAEGLRCAYHGWKFDHTGRCSDLPNEAPDCPLKNKVRLRAYPCRERNGVVWAYLGPRAEPPPLPDLEWNLRPDSIPAGRQRPHAALAARRLLGLRRRHPRCAAAPGSCAPVRRSGTGQAVFQRLRQPPAGAIAKGVG